MRNWWLFSDIICSHYSLDTYFDHFSVITYYIRLYDDANCIYGLNMKLLIDLLKPWSLE